MWHNRPSPHFLFLRSENQSVGLQTSNCGWKESSSDTFMYLFWDQRRTRNSQAENSWKIIKLESRFYRQVQHTWREMAAADPYFNSGIPLVLPNCSEIFAYFVFSVWPCKRMSVFSLNTNVLLIDLQLFTEQSKPCLARFHANAPTKCWIIVFSSWGKTYQHHLHSFCRISFRFLLLFSNSGL